MNEVRKAHSADKSMRKNSAAVKTNLSVDIFWEKHFSCSTTSSSESPPAEMSEFCVQYLCYSRQSFHKLLLERSWFLII